MTSTKTRKVSNAPRRPTPKTRRKPSTATRPAKQPVRYKPRKAPVPTITGTAETGREGTKTKVCVDLLRRPKGASIEELQAATGWQAHSVRGFLSGAIKKKLGLILSSEKEDGRGRVYRIVEA